MMGIVEALRLITDPGDAVVVCSPVYPPFYAFVTHADRRVIEAPLGADWRLDLDALADAFDTARRSRTGPCCCCVTRTIPLAPCTPASELTAVAALARQYGVRVISDEIHAPLVLAGAEFVPYLSVPGAEDAFALYSASKGWNLAGLKAALLVAGPDAVDDLARLPEEVSHGPSHVGILAHTAAFEHGTGLAGRPADGLDQQPHASSPLWSPNSSRRSTMVRPEATYLAWLDCRSFGLHSNHRNRVPAWSATCPVRPRCSSTHARVALSSGHVFGTAAQGSSGSTTPPPRRSCARPSSGWDAPPRRPRYP